MDISANFAFLKQEFPHAAESASFAERHVFGDPRASCFHARHALERLLKRVYKVEKALKPPKVTNLDGYISDLAFRELVPEVIWQKAEFVRQAGNVAVHGTKTPAPKKALDVLRELYHVLYWTGRTYLRKGAESLQGKTFDESLVPNMEPAPTPASVQELEALKARLDAAAEARKEIESELEALRERLAAIKAENQGVHETHDWNEDKTRTLIINLDLERAGWLLDRGQDREYKVTGMPNESGVGYADYVLWGDDGKPLAVVEAKKTTVDPEVGQQQAKLYADCLETMHGQRPVIFYTNGYETRLWDDLAYPPRLVAGFYKKEELASLIIRRAQRAPARCVAGEERHRRAVLPETGHWQHRGPVCTSAAQGAAGDGYRQRQDTHGDCPGGPAATGGLGEAGVIPGRPRVAGEPSRWCVQGTPAPV